MGSFWIGLSLGVLFSYKFSRKKKGKKSAEFVCPHCEVKDTLQSQKLRNKDVYTCSFCERIIDEDFLRLSFKEEYELLKKNPEEYEALKKVRKEGKAK